MARFQGDLPERTYQFSLAILTIVDALPNNMKGWEIGRQLLRSGMSVGANVQEADAALTEREFIQFCNVSRREALETFFWLRASRDKELLSGDLLAKCLTEAGELVKISLDNRQKESGQT